MHAGTDPTISSARRTRLRGICGANRTCPTWEARPAILEARFSILEGAHMLAFVPLRPVKTSGSPSPWSSNELRAPSGTHLISRTRVAARTLACKLTTLEILLDAYLYFSDGVATWILRYSWIFFVDRPAGFVDYFHFFFVLPALCSSHFHCCSVFGSSTLPIDSLLHLLYLYLPCH